MFFDTVFGLVPRLNGIACPHVLGLPSTAVGGDSMAIVVVVVIALAAFWYWEWYRARRAFRRMSEDARRGQKR